MTHGAQNRSKITTAYGKSRSHPDALYGDLLPALAIPLRTYGLRYNPGIVVLRLERSDLFRGQRASSVDSSRLGCGTFQESSAHSVSSML